MAKILATCRNNVSNTGPWIAADPKTVALCVRRKMATFMFYMDVYLTSFWFCILRMLQVPANENPYSNT